MTETATPPLTDAEKQLLLAQQGLLLQCQTLTLLSTLNAALSAGGGSVWVEHVAGVNQQAALQVAAAKVAIARTVTPPGPDATPDQVEPYNRIVAEAANAERQLEAARVTAAAAVPPPATSDVSARQLEATRATAAATAPVRPVDRGGWD